MTDLRVVDDLLLSEARYWDEIFLDDAFNRRLFLERLRFSEYRVKSQESVGDEVRRVLVAAPPLGEMPGALKKLVGDSVSYEERGVFNKVKRRYEFTVVPSTLADKVSIRGSLHLEPISDTSCRRIFEATITARIMLVGGVLESKIASDLERSQKAAARFTNDYAREHSPA
ncbi:MAG: DUF2505 domain-containing protein [Polyangiaceae bacterium]|nr:DUF2505 domain-containing protein [Polyangiaceae bacterium]